MVFFLVFDLGLFFVIFFLVFSVGNICMGDRS